MILPILYIAPAPGKGRGVFTSEAIPAGTVVEIAPVIIMPAADREWLDKTLLHDYIFEWGADKQHCCMALGYVPVYNHAAPANCEYEMDYEDDLIHIHTTQNIAAGEELCINYNGHWDNESPVWFSAR